MSAHRFHVFELARELETRGLLGRLITARPRRTVNEVSAELVDSRPWIAAANHAVTRITRRQVPALDRALITDFDRWAANRLPDADAVTALSGFGTRTLQVAAKRGTRTACDRGSWHIQEQATVLAAEQERWGVRSESVDPWIIERELEDYACCDRIMVPSQPALASFVRRGVDARKLRKVPYGVDIGRFHSARGARRAGSVISVGPLSLRKGHQYLLPAYRRVRRPGSHLTLLGRIDRAMVDRFAIHDDDVTLAGTVPRADMPAKLASFSIFALASIEEGLATVIPQAMASGLAVVITDATGGGEFVTDGLEGFVVPSRSEEALAAALDALLANPDLTRAMGEAGRARVEAQGGWRSYGDLAVEALIDPDQQPAP